MIVRSGKGSFLAARYEWLVLAVGLAVLVAGLAFYVSSLGEDADEHAAAAVARIARLKPTATGVKPTDMTALAGTLRVMRSPVAVAELPERGESFLASERRVLCACGKAIPGDAKLCPKCPFCGELQEAEKVIALDADNDGLPDEWERKYGLNPADPADATADADGDGFTNAEEFAAKTDPTDKNDHPDYLDSLKIVLPLKETTLPFVFRKANKIPTGWRCEFFDPVRRDNYGRKGATLTAVLGEEIADTGYILREFAEKSARQTIRGAAGLTKTVDASEAVVERKRDGKRVTLAVQQGRAVKLAAVDVQVTLVYERGASERFEVVPGGEIALNGCKYKIVEIVPVGKGAKVTIENALSGQKRTLEALEP